MLSVRRCSNSMTEAVVSRASQAGLAMSAPKPQQPLSAASPAVDTVNMYLLDKAFLRLLESYGLGNEPVTFETIVHSLKQYIVSHGLFHVSRPDVIICSGDPLGVLFKRTSFTNREAVSLIRKHISPVFTQKRHDVGSPACIKASTDVKVLDGVNDDHKASSSEEESESVEELDVEIAFSEQGSGSGLSLFEEFQDSGKRIVGSLSSSDSLSDLDELDDPEDRTAASVVSILSEYNEFEPLSDGGSDDDLESFSSDSDLEIVENPWFCKCQSDEAKSSKGFCHSCWTAQFGWRKEDERRVPPSVQRRKRAKRHSAQTDESALNTKRRRIDLGQLTNYSETASLPLDGSSEDVNSASQGQCSTVSVCESSVSTDTTPTTSPIGVLDALGTCIICESRSRNTAFCHGRSAHIVACYKCSRKVQEKGLKCPQCRRIVERVVRLYV
ncbi:E3 ubiquitin-protein ligase Mdm2-like isoform X5 [Varroa jacobsoni]|uniref:DM2 domain-containing protein n=1 Tax=Varroa destructor TaxID=109461 RepID=A0A7M7MDT0_VARDE|nr:E3 ubiquitin-protein ligase Mdm2-like isoform X3 [Varroa destructor]XP_022695507.1 E3 ubiquitin-protein ligase Mdm2-like isoform X5 [Varroa jacobsoni]